MRTLTAAKLFLLFLTKKTFEVQKRPQRLAVPDLWGFQNPEGLDGGKGYEESFKIYRT
ncbi:hypothetical protein [Mongoliibacter ruber]|uniref:hypothetical protein n=1 Tax=Mongoliibacter ruber TaxID=1750599 RepID=UPI001472CAA9|nr:hypothetical protein [Mongoliibacter ruber]